MDIREYVTDKVKVFNLTQDEVMNTIALFVTSQDTIRNRCDRFFFSNHKSTFDTFVDTSKSISLPNDLHKDLEKWAKANHLTVTKAAILFINSILQMNDTSSKMIANYGYLNSTSPKDPETPAESED